MAACRLHACNQLTAVTPRGCSISGAYQGISSVTTGSTGLHACNWPLPGRPGSLSSMSRGVGGSSGLHACNHPAFRSDLWRMRPRCLPISPAHRSGVVRSRRADFLPCPIPHILVLHAWGVLVNESDCTRATAPGAIDLRSFRVRGMRLDLISHDCTHPTDPKGCPSCDSASSRTTPKLANKLDGGDDARPDKDYTRAIVSVLIA